jgi:hypothetical protein
MKNIILFLAFFVSVLSFSSAAHAEISESDLKVLAEKILALQAKQDQKGYLKLIHPECPLPEKERLKSSFSSKWLTDKPYYIRYPNVMDSYDMKVLTFDVEPEAAIEIQVWTMDSTGDTIQLVTGFPVARHNNTLKILDYPCFRLK